MFPIRVLLQSENYQAKESGYFLKPALKLVQQAFRSRYQESTFASEIQRYKIFAV